MNKIYSQVVVTLFEKHYHYGVSALINSLSKSGFKGLVRIGYRGSLPFWVKQLKPQGELNKYSLSDGIDICFDYVSTDIHFGYYKPNFIRETFFLYPEVDTVFYFDPDIVVNTKWIFYSEWVFCGIALCLDNCFPYVHENHPWRKAWRGLAEAESDKSKINVYVNSGFIGIRKKDILFLDKWIHLTNHYNKKGGDISLFEKDGARAFKGDQDLLNATITSMPFAEYSIIGTEGMGFTQPAYLMSHAVGDIKPWKKNYVKHLIKRGQKPSVVEKSYFEHCNAPIKVYSIRGFFLKKTLLKIASLLGRFIG